MLLNLLQYLIAESIGLATTVALIERLQIEYLGIFEVSNPSQIKVAIIFFLCD
jgi:hypothetical protein